MIFPFIKYKQQKEPCVAKGPTIKHALHWQGRFKGSPFSIALPSSNERGYEPDLSPGIGRVDYGWYDYEARDSVKRWSNRGFLNRHYRFWGPRGVGRVSRMGCVGWFSRIRKPKEGVSLFHPRAFEFEVIDYIEDDFTNYSEEEYLSLAPNTVRAPIDWMTFDHLPGPTAFFKVDTGTCSAPNYYFATVVDDNDLLFLGFSLDPSMSGPKHIPPEEWVDQRNMKQLMFDIFNTLELKLSAESDKHRLEVIKGLNDPSLKKTMETQTFYTHPDRVSGNNAEKRPNKAIR